MRKRVPTHFFQKKVIRSADKAQTETIDSLWESTNQIFTTNTQNRIAFFKHLGAKYKSKINRQHILKSLQQLAKAKTLLLYKLDFLVKDFRYTWILGSALSFCIVAVIFIAYPAKIVPELHDKYSIYSAKPLTLGSLDYLVYTKDSRSQKINEIFKEFNCPLEGLGEVFVYEADKNDIPWWIVASIAFQESSCGKMTPERNGVESYNAWGWAVYGDNVQMFDNWVRGIETVSSYLNKRFFSQGITEPCDIMKVYTPPSNGSWCKGVSYFGEMIQSYKSPTE